MDLEIALAESEEEKGNLQLRVIELEEAADNEVILLSVFLFVCVRVFFSPNTGSFAAPPKFNEREGEGRERVGDITDMLPKNGVGWGGGPWPRG